jgi:predicted nuclease of predicted toxin-antitoxin system
MRLLADECVSRKLIQRIRQNGVDIESVAETAPGTKDEAVLAKSVETGRVLLTEDYDFAQLVFRFRRKALGVILISPSLSERPFEELAVIVCERLEKQASGFEGMLTILEPDRTRQRALPE